MTRVNRLSIGIFLILLLCIKACGIYSFTGASIPAGASTFQVNFSKIKQVVDQGLPLNQAWIEILP